MKFAKKRERLDKTHKGSLKGSNERLRGGSRTLRTRETKKTVSPPKQLNRDELSGKIQWLIDFAGSEDIMKHIISKYTTFKKIERLLIMGKMDENAGYKNKIIFNTYGGGAGHWIYFSRTGEEFNSYKLGHQKPLTNQFCQSFAIMYLLQDCGLPDMPDFVSRLQSTLTIPGKKPLPVTQKNDIWGNNIEVVIDMWRWIFNKKSSKTWIITEMKLINDEYIAFNAKTKVKSKHAVLIADNTADIDFKTIENKLDDIVVHKIEIARET